MSLDIGLTYDEARELPLEALRELAHGELWTAKEAEEKLRLPKGIVDAWVSRGYLKPGWTLGRSRYYWEHDLIDCKQVSRNQRETRDDSGRFKRRTLLTGM